MTYPFASQDDSYTQMAGPLVVDDPLNPPPGVIPFGRICPDTPDEQVIGMPVSGLSTHMYLCGSTGSGKSTLIEQFIFGLAKSGESMVIVDLHGTLIDNSLAYLLHHAPERAKDCLVLDFNDPQWPVSFNPLSVTSPAEVGSAVNAIQEALENLFQFRSDAEPSVMGYAELAFRALAEANLHVFGEQRAHALNLLMVPAFFTDKSFRDLVMRFCSHPPAMEIFGPESAFERLGERQQLELMMPILRTFSAFSVKESFSNTFGQSDSKVDFAQWIRDGKIVMIKVPQNATDAAVAAFIGALVTPMIIGSLPKWGRDEDTSCYLIIDEFQNCATESFCTLLAGARHYGLHGIAINQVPQDLPADVLRAVQLLPQTKITMRLDSRAVKDVTDFIASGNAHPSADDIVALDNHWGWANVKMDDGKSSGPFTFKALPPIYEPGSSMMRSGSAATRTTSGCCRRSRRARGWRRLSIATT